MCLDNRALCYKQSSRSGWRISKKKVNNKFRGFVAQPRPTWRIHSIHDHPRFTLRRCPTRPALRRRRPWPRPWWPGGGRCRGWRRGRPLPPPCRPWPQRPEEREGEGPWLNNFLSARMRNLPLNALLTFQFADLFRWSELQNLVAFWILEPEDGSKDVLGRFLKPILKTWNLSLRDSKQR